MIFTLVLLYLWRYIRSWLPKIDVLTPEEACEFICERELTIKYKPVILEFDRKPSSLNVESEV